LTKLILLKSSINGLFNQIICLQASYTVIFVMLVKKINPAIQLLGTNHEISVDVECGRNVRPLRTLSCFSVRPSRELTKQRLLIQPNANARDASFATST
jgi:hypothetical protein